MSGLIRSRLTSVLQSVVRDHPHEAAKNQNKTHGAEPLTEKVSWLLGKLMETATRGVFEFI